MLEFLFFSYFRFARVLCTSQDYVLTKKEVVIHYVLHLLVSLAAFEFPRANLSLLFHYIMDKIDIRDEKV